MAVIIKSTGGRGYGTKLFNDNGEEILGVTDVTISIRPDDLVRADIQIFAAEIDVRAEPTFYVSDPSTGEAKPVASINFADGSSWKAESA